MKRLKERLKRCRMTRRSCCILLALILAAGCLGGGLYFYHTDTPELTSFVDDSLEPIVSIEEDEVPLGKTQVTTKKKTKTSKKVVKLKTASKKTYKVKKPTKTKTQKKTTKNSSRMVTVKTTTVTAVTESYTKKEKKKVVTTKVTTTTQTTTTDLSQGAQSGDGVAAKQTRTGGSAAGGSYTADIDSIASKADRKIRDAYNTLGFSVEINSGVSYSGYFNAKAQQIILKKQDDTIYHELGHFLAFLAGNVDTKSTFVTVYNTEKNKYTGTNKAYVTQSSSEYFAESYRDYVLNPQALKNSRPDTYEAIEQALDKITDSYVSRVKTAYSAIWK